MNLLHHAVPYTGIMAIVDQEALVMKTIALRERPVPAHGLGLERYLADLKKHEDDVLALGDGMGGQPWCRVHVELVHSGIWARLKPCSQAVYLVLVALSDRRKRATYSGVKKVADLAGFSVSRTLFAYSELKGYGLIFRKRVRMGKYRPYMTWITNPGRWTREAGLVSSP